MHCLMGREREMEWRVKGHRINWRWMDQANRGSRMTDMRAKERMGW